MHCNYWNHRPDRRVIGRILPDAGQPIRAVVRNADKGRAWTDRGCEVAVATIENAASLTAAFRAAEGVLCSCRQTLIRGRGFPRRGRLGQRCAPPWDGAAGGSGLSLHHRSAGESDQPADLAHDYRAGARRSAGAGHVSASGLVYGKLPVGCVSGA